MATKTYIQDPNNPNVSIPQTTKPLSALVGGNNIPAQTLKTTQNTTQPKVASASSVPSTEQQNNLKNIMSILEYRKQQNIPENQTTSDYFNSKTPTSNVTTPTTNASMGTENTSNPGTTPTGTSALQDMANKGTLYSQLVQNLANYQTPENLKQAYNTVTNLESGLQAGQNAIMTKPIPLEFQQGQAAALQRDYGPQLTAAKGILEKELAGAQLGQQALTSAIGAAAPTQLPYNVQYVNPLTGLPIGGGTSSTMNDAVSNIITKVKNGTMGYDAGVNALSAYGQAGVNALQQGLGADFNIQESNARAAAQGASTLQTGTTGGQITKAAESANSALTKLETDFGNLPTFQTGGLPGTNNIANSIARFFGEGALSTYETTLNDARAQIAAVLGSAGNITPTDADTMAKSYLPDNMTPQQLKSKVDAARALIQQKVSAYTSTGGTTGGETSTSGISEGSTKSVGGYNFVYKNGQWIAQ